MINRYQENGYKDRQDYLQCLSDDYRVPLEVVQAAAEILGDNEDFDGLVSAMYDAEKMVWE